MGGTTTDTELHKTPLHALHVELGGRMVPFAGYDMPVQFPTGILTEHNWTREKAGLFDVSHMGQARLWGADADKAMEKLVPGNLTGLALTRIRYTVFTNDLGAKLVGGTNTDAQVQAANEYFLGLAKTMNVEVAPRYGKWDPSQMLADLPVNDLSVAAAQ